MKKAKIANNSPEWLLVDLVNAVVHVIIVIHSIPNPRTNQIHFVANFNTHPVMGIHVESERKNSLEYLGHDNLKFGTWRKNWRK